MVPLVIDLLRSFAFFKRGSGTRASAATVSVFLIAAVSSICAIGLALFWEHLLPFLCPEPRSVEWIALAGAGMYLAIATSVSHIACVLVSPGEAAATTKDDDSARPFAGPVGSEYCKVCRRTVLDMDHHCLFTGRCIGRYNKRFFILFILHLWVGATFAVLTSIPALRTCLLPLLRSERLVSATCRVVRSARMAIIPALMVWIPITPLAVWHFGLLLADRTTAHFVRTANAFGVRSAFMELASTRWKPARDNLAWQLVKGDFKRARDLRQ
mmetsp:Transcript_5937/g.17663  ORF Transcript_5937/g.17663 Transcript_5937/m.17663 type:complete len:270 (-) Transcript_5937:111-920(-)